MFEKIKNAFLSLTGLGPVAEETPAVVEAAPVVAVEAAPEVAVEAEVEAEVVEHEHVEEIAPVEEAAPVVVEVPVVEVPVVEAPAPAGPKNRHVVPADKGWKIVAPGNPEALASFAKKKDAIEAGHEMCKALKSELFIHGKNGKIQDRCSFGNDSPKRKG